MFTKKLMALGVVGVGLGAAGLAQAIDGTIHFTGSISTASCTVSSVADVSSTTGTVGFGTVSSKTFTAVGGNTVATPFAIELTDCVVATPPTITFNGEPVATVGHTSLFKTGIPQVGIRISDADTPATIYTPGIATANSGLSTLSATSSSATAKFNASLVAHQTAATPGDLDTTITFTINYS